MRIIIAGDGETGTHLAEMLSVENQDVVLIGSDKGHLSDLESSNNFITFAGNATSVSDLMQCRADTTDLFIAVTPDENINLLSCELAKACGATKCIARIDSPEFSSDFTDSLLKRLGVDRTFYPERLAAESIMQFIRHNWVSEWLPLSGGEIAIVAARVTASGTLCGKTLKDAACNPRTFHVSAIKRGDRTIIPRGDDMILENDTVYFSTLPDKADTLSAICGKRHTPTRKIMITGGGRITENLLNLIGTSMNVTVFEPDSERCRELAVKFPKTVIVNSTSNDVTTLKDEGIDKCDMFIALTGSSEANIVSCMVAREHGVPKTVARIEEFQYIPEAESLSIDKIINKKRLNTSSVFDVLLDGDKEGTQCLSLPMAEMTALQALDSSKITAHQICRLSLPRELTVGGLIRNGKGMLVDGDTQIKAGDVVVVFFTSGNLSKVKKLFD